MIKIDTSASRSVAFLVPSIIVVISFLVALLIQQSLHPLRIGHDQALYLQCGFLLLNGGIPYVDFLDSNPPLIFYLNTIPALISQSLRMPPPLAFDICVWLLLVSSCVLCQVLMVRRRCQNEFAIYFPLAISLPLFSCCLNGDFGQREHLYLILYFPFLLARWISWSGGKLSYWEASIVGIIGGIGLSLKPYFFIPALFYEIYWLIEKRDYRPLLRPEVYFCALAMAIYVIHFLFLPAAELKSYFGFIAPMFFYGYSFWDVTTIGMLGIANWGKVFPFVFISLFVAIYMRRQTSLILPLIVFALASLIGYFLQGKGWSYHPLPFFFAGMVLALIEIWLMLRYLWHKSKLPIFVLLYGISLIVIGMLYQNVAQDILDVKNAERMDLARFGWPGYTAARGDLGTFAPAIMKRTNVNDRVIVISNGVQPAYPALLQLRRWPGTRHLQALLLSMFDYISDQPSTPDRRRLVAMKQKVIDEYKEDIQKFRPKLIAIQECPLLEFVQRFHFIDKDMRDYQKVDTFNGFVLYQKR
jgi:hypothetical protein